MLNWPVLSASFEESPHHLQFLTSLEGFTGGRRIKGGKTVEEIAYHAVIHLLMGALGFIPSPNKGRQDNSYLYVGQHWKYSKLSADPCYSQQYLALLQVPSLLWATWASGLIFSAWELHFPPKGHGMVDSPCKT